MAHAQWKLSGVYDDIWNCTVSCPCWWGIALPTTEGVGEFFNAFHAARGNFRGTNLSGLAVVMAGVFTDLVLDGGWHVGLCVDAAVTEEQHRALTTIFSGRAGGASSDPAGLITEVYGVTYVPIHHRTDGKTVHRRIGTRGESRGSLLPGGRAGTPVRADNTPLGPAVGLTEALTTFRTDVFVSAESELGGRWDNGDRSVWRAAFA